MKIYSIYKATNLFNQKSYIGFDSNWPNRKRKHLNSNGSCPKFHNAIKKYGKDNFKWEILYQSKDAVHTLKVMEPHFIQEYKCEYNIRKGGEGVANKSLTDKQRQAVINSNKNRINTIETKKKISAARLGATHSLSTKSKMSLSAKNRWAKQRSAKNT